MEAAVIFSDLQELDSVEPATSAHSTKIQLRLQELESVVLATDWPDLHHSDAVFAAEDDQVVCAGRQSGSGMVSIFKLNVRSCAPFAETARPLTQSSGRRSFKEPLKGGKMCISSLTMKAIETHLQLLFYIRL